MDRDASSATSVDPQRLNVVLPAEEDGLRAFNERRRATLERARLALKAGLPALFVELDDYETRDMFRPRWSSKEALAVATRVVHMVSDVGAALNIIKPKESEGDNANASIIQGAANFCENIIHRLSPVYGAIDLVAVSALRVSETTKNVAEARRGESNGLFATNTEETAQAMERYASDALIVRLRKDILELLEYVNKHMDKIVAPLGHDHSSKMY